MIKLSREEIKPLLETHIYELLDEDKYIIEKIDPKNLINKSRFDLNSKLLYLDGLSNKNYNYEDLYYSFVNAFTLGSFKEPGNSYKNSFEIYKKSFAQLYKSLNLEDFNIKKSLVPISKEGIVLDGSHRVAAAIKLKKNIYCIRINIKPPNYDQNFFKSRLVSESFLDQCAQKQIEIDKKIHVAVIWPAGFLPEFKIENFLPNIFYKKKLNLSLNGLKNFVKIVYEGEEWLGSQNNGYYGAFSKALPCYSNAPISLILFKPPKNKDLILLKSEIRSLLLKGKNSIHINDNHDEAIRITKSFFNKNTMHFLDNYRDREKRSFNYNFEQFKDFISKKKINRNLIALDGSMVLSAYSLRDARDIDFIAHTSIKKNIKTNQKSLISMHNKHVENFYGNNLDELITDSRNYFVFQDFKFVSLNQLSKMKSKRREKKDLIDLMLINSITKNSLFLKLNARYNQFIFFTFFRVKKYVITILKKIKLYGLSRRIYYLISDIKKKFLY